MQENASLQLAEQNHCSRTKYANKARSKYGDKAVATVLQTELQRLKEKLQHRNIVSQEVDTTLLRVPTVTNSHTHTVTDCFKFALRPVGKAKVPRSSPKVRSFKR